MNIIEKYGTDINFSATLIIKMVCLLVIWLHSRAGVSRAVTNKVLQAIQVIISATLYLVGIALMSSGFAVKLSNVKLPHDVRTAYQLHCPEPEIIWTGCWNLNQPSRLLSKLT